MAPDIPELRARGRQPPRGRGPAAARPGLTEPWHGGQGWALLRLAQLGDRLRHRRHPDEEHDGASGRSGSRARTARATTRRRRPGAGRAVRCADAGQLSHRETAPGCNESLLIFSIAAARLDQQPHLVEAPGQMIGLQQIA